MTTFTPCRPEDLMSIRPQAGQALERAFLIDGHAGMIEASLALAAWRDGRCVGAGGIRPIWPGRAAAWVLLGADAGPSMPAITRRLRWVLASYPADRVEMVTRSDFPEARRLANLLGFQCETPEGMPRFFPDGCAGYLYARTKT